MSGGSLANQPLDREGCVCSLQAPDVLRDDRQESFIGQKSLAQFKLRPAGSDPEDVCQKNSFLKVSVSLGGFGPSVAHGKHSAKRRCVQATKNKAETCSRSP